MYESKLLEGDVPVFESCSSSGINGVKFKHRWTIDGFSLRWENVGEYIKSSLFSAGPKDSRRWCLLLYPRGKLPYTSYTQTVFALQLVSCEKSKVRAFSKMSILVDESVKYTHNEGTKEFTLGTISSFSKHFERNQILNPDRGFLQNDKLTILCEIIVLENNVNIPGQRFHEQLKDPLLTLSDDLMRLYEDQDYADVILSVSGREIRAHKNILAIRSPVLAAMFKTDWAEGMQGKVEIRDIDSEVMTEMLRFIYTGVVKGADEKAEELVKAAEKYQVDGLKEMCEDLLCERLNAENAADYLVLADVYRVNRLKNHAIDFINSHSSEVQNSAGWQTLYTSHSHLLVEAWMNLSSFTPSEEENNGK